jgi:hypothetical protein
MASYYAIIWQNEVRFWLLAEFVQTRATFSEGKPLDKGAGDRKLNAITELRQK